MPRGFLQKLGELQTPQLSPVLVLLEKVEGGSGEASDPTLTPTPLHEAGAAQRPWEPQLEPAGIAKADSGSKFPH